LRRPSTDE